MPDPLQLRSTAAVRSSDESAPPKYASAPVSWRPAAAVAAAAAVIVSTGVLRSRKMSPALKSFRSGREDAGMRGFACGWLSPSIAPGVFTATAEEGFCCCCCWKGRFCACGKDLRVQRRATPIVDFGRVSRACGLACRVVS